MNISLASRPTLLQKLRANTLRVALVTAMSMSGTAVADSCKGVMGTISPLQPVACSSPDVLACFQGTLTGDLTGTFQSALTGLQPVANQPGNITFTARSIVNIQAPNGVVSTVDAGVGSNCQVINGQNLCFHSNEVLVITSGTRAYKQVRGTFVLSGGYMAGQLGSYQGIVCRGHGGEKTPG